MQARLDEVDRLRKKQVERARYEADLAQRRYLHVDPANRLVADSLEADWNHKLRALHAAQEQYEEQCKNDRAQISEQQRASIARCCSLICARSFLHCSSYCSWAACSARSLWFQSASRESATRRFAGST